MYVFRLQQENATYNAISASAVHSAVGHHPRGTTLQEALQRNLPLKGFSGASARVSSRVLRGLRGALPGSAGFFEGSEPVLVTLGNCWRKEILFQGVAREIQNC